MGGQGLGLGLVRCNPPAGVRGRGQTCFPMVVEVAGGGALGSRGQHCGSGCSMERDLPPPAQPPTRGITGPSPGTVVTLRAW